MDQTHNWLDAWINANAFNTFPLNMIESREIRIQIDDDSDDDVPDLIFDKEPIKVTEPQTFTDRRLDKVVSLINEETKDNEMSINPNPMTFPRNHTSAMSFSSFTTNQPKPFSYNDVVPVYDVNRNTHSTIPVQVYASAIPAQSYASAISKSAVSESTASESTASESVSSYTTTKNEPKSYVLSNAEYVAKSTPEDDQFIANYMKQHGATEIQRALAKCRKEYRASLDKNDETKYDDEDYEDDEDDEVYEDDDVHLCPNINNVSENPIKYTQTGHIETDISISGKKFNEIFAGVPLIKLTNESCCHNGMNFVEGENIDNNEFRFDQSCGADGIYFCRLEDMFSWLEYSSSPMYYMWDAEISVNARAVMYRNKLKANRLILSNKRKISHYVCDKLMGMVQNSEAIEKIFNIIDSLTPQTYPDVQSMEKIYLGLLERDFDIFDRIPEESRSYNICLFLATNDPDGYQKIRDEYISHEMLMGCVKKNPDVYRQIPEKERSQEMSQYLFDLNSMNYVVINDEHKSVQMTEQYLTETKDIDSMDSTQRVTASIPRRFINEPSVARLLVQKNGEILKEIDFRLKDYDLCRSAVTNSGIALRSVPLALIDQDMCNCAIIGSSDAYEFIPLAFRTTELKEAMIRADPYNICRLQSDEITHNMIMCVVSDAMCLDQNDPFDFESQHISDIFTKYMEEYINVCPSLYLHIPESLFTDEMALLMVNKNPNSFEIFAERSTEFIVRCVKMGISFSNIPRHEVTQEMLNELVGNRRSVLDELPTNFLSDDLYIICMRFHGMTLSEVPEGFRTSRLAKIALDLYPSESEIRIDQIEQNVIPSDQITEADINMHGII